MCDYSIQAKRQRQAVVGERLKIRILGGYNSRGFSPPGEPETAVCLRPDNEVMLELTPELARTYSLPQRPKAKFAYLSGPNSCTYRDGLVFENGKKVLINSLPVGLVAEVVLTEVDEAKVEVLVESARQATPEMVGAGTGSTRNRFVSRFFG